MSYSAFYQEVTKKLNSLHPKSNSRRNVVSARCRPRGGSSSGVHKSLSVGGSLATSLIPAIMKLEKDRVSGTKKLNDARTSVHPDDSNDDDDGVSDVKLENVYCDKSDGWKSNSSEVSGKNLSGRGIGSAVLEESESWRMNNSGASSEDFESFSLEEAESRGMNNYESGMSSEDLSGTGVGSVLLEEAESRGMNNYHSGASSEDLSGIGVGSLSLEEAEGREMNSYSGVSSEGLSGRGVGSVLLEESGESGINQELLMTVLETATLYQLWEALKSEKRTHSNRGITFDLWLKEKQKKYQEEKERSEKERQEKEEARKERKERAHIAFERWCEVAKKRPKPPPFMALATDKDSKKYTRPGTFYNPIPWVNILEEEREATSETRRTESVPSLPLTTRHQDDSYRATVSFSKVFKQDREKKTGRQSTYDKLVDFYADLLNRCIVKQHHNLDRCRRNNDVVKSVQSCLSQAKTYTVYSARSKRSTVCSGYFLHS